MQKQEYFYYFYFTRKLFLFFAKGYIEGSFLLLVSIFIRYELRVKGVEPQSVFIGIFPPALRQNPREYASIHCSFSSIRQKSTREKLHSTENEKIFLGFFGAEEE